MKLKTPDFKDIKGTKLFIKMCNSEIREWEEALLKAREELARMSEPQERLREATKT